MKKYSWSGTTAWVCILVVALVSLVHHVKRDWPLLAVWDVYGYYVYLPAAFTFHELGDFGFVERHFDEYPMNSGIYQLQDTGDGHRVPIYTIGMAMVWMPGYLLADTAARLTGWERDGMSLPYQFAILLSSLVFALIGIQLLRRFLQNYFPDRLVAIVLVAVVFGTNLFQNMAFEPGMPHSYIFAGHAAVLFYTHRWFANRRLRDLIVLAAAIALLCLIRPTEVIVVLIPLLYGVSKGWASQLRETGWYQVLIAFAMACFLVMLQIIFWRANTGEWIYNAYSEAGHAFHWDGRFLLDGLFSYRKGWLVYTPLMGLCLLGIFFMQKNIRAWRLPVLMVLALHIYITFSWHMWWYANSFGARPMVHVYPELSIALASLLLFLSRRKPLLYVALAAMGLFTALNLFQTWQYNNRILPGDYMTRTYYWEVFGRTRIERETLKYLFSHKPPSGGQKVELAVWEADTTDLAEDSTRYTSVDGLYWEVLVPAREFSASTGVKVEEGDMTDGDSQWFYLEAGLNMKSANFDADQQALMVFEAKRAGQHLFWHGVPFQTFTPVDTPYNVEWHYRSEQPLLVGDELNLLIWNRNSPDTILLHDLGIYRLAY